MPRKEYLPGQVTAVLEDAEALGILYAVSVGKAYTPTGMAPDSYGPGRQPVPREAYYQRYYSAPLDAVVANPALGIPADLPARLEIDAFALAQDTKAVVLKSKAKTITLDFKTLVVSAASVAKAARNA